MNQITPATAGLTPDQQAGAEAFFHFLMSKDKSFVLSGGPGVGKTYLMAHLCKETMREYEMSCALLGRKSEFDSLIFTTTTNKAAEVLENSLNLPVQTIHSFLGLKVKEDFKTGKTNLIRTNNWRLRRRLIVFIDEYSMIDTTLYKTIMESFEDSKIVFVGDQYQMAPVGEKSSPVTTSVDPSNFVHLSTPVRNAGQPALVALCKQLRETVETGVFRPIKEVPGVIEYHNEDTLPPILDREFKALDPSSRILCYTNTRVEAFNDHIRQEVRHQPAEFGVNDVLVVAQTHAARTDGKEITINVEREVQILSLSEIHEDHHYSDAFVDKMPILYREATIKIGSAGRAFSVKMPLDKQRVVSAIKYYSSKKAWGDYFDLKAEYIDLRDKAACTVYKSQGSTYESVVIDLGNIGTSWDADQVARMLLVAASRATTKIFLFGRLPPAYHGKDNP